MLLALAIAICSGAANADALYKCTTARGTVLYTNQGADRTGCTLLGQSYLKMFKVTIQGSTMELSQ